MDPLGFDHQAAGLAQSLANGCDTNDIGSATVAVYDTAWLSMISRTINEHSQWQFPECFQYLLKTQAADGTWSASQTPDDQILNTMAALLALKKRAHVTASEAQIDQKDLQDRIIRATSSLQNILQDWDVESCMYVGFEILIPAMINMLEQENILFTFPGLPALEMLNKKKLCRFEPEMLYKSPTPLLHSLEAFIGKIDFDKVRHHGTACGMLASPASTAAFLMNSSTWDDEAEMYLRKVILSGYGHGTGGVPSVFPISIFETTWAVSTLIQGGFTIEQLGQQNCNRISNYLEKHLNLQDGLLGFSMFSMLHFIDLAKVYAKAPSVISDADDTAKTILTLNLLGRDTRPDAMISCFKTNDGHFCTYPGERDASFSANCNILQALLYVRNPQEYREHIISTTSYLCEAWWKGKAKDKWNASSHYSMMLLAQALMRLLPLWSAGTLNTISENLLKDRIPVVLIQLLTQTMCSQHCDGSWGISPSAEMTAYAVITLKELSILPWAISVVDDVHFAIQAGQRFLEKCREDWTKPQYLWIEKVKYGNPTLSLAYCLSAMKPPPGFVNWHDHVNGLVSLPEEAIVKSTRFMLALFTFQNTPPWKIKLSVIEGLLFLPQLKSAGTEFVPLQSNAKNKYLDLIPLTWIIENNTKDLLLPASLLWDMMVLTVCNFRIDEYMESFVATMNDAMLQKTKDAINELCRGEIDQPNGIEDRKRPHEDSANHKSYDCMNEKSSLSDFEAVISHYVEAMLTYPSIQHASKVDRSMFRARVQEFLLSHIDQIQDNKRFTKQVSWSASQPTILEAPRSSFFIWLQTIGADSVSAPMSFAFFTCLLGASAYESSAGIRDRMDCFTTISHKYLANDLSARLASMSRLYNDYGSIVRDRAEGNINCVNFAEFHAEITNSESAEAREMALKKKLMVLAELEREAVGFTGGKLIGVLNGSGRAREGKIARALTLFMGTTALYADMYVAKDLSNSVRRS